MNDKKKTLITAIIAGMVLLLIDFASKGLANARLAVNSGMPQATALPFLKWYLAHNTGYHFIFGEIRNHNLWAGAGLVFVLALLYSLASSLLKEPYDRFYQKIHGALIALTIGAMGNVLEILIAGHATDFFIFKPFPWPSNLCDQYINGIVYIILPIILIKSIIDRKRQKKNDGADNFQVK